MTLHALGPGSEALRGPMENFEVGRRIERVMGWDLDRLTAELPAPEMAAHKFPSASHCAPSGPPLTELGSSYSKRRLDGPTRSS